MTKVIKRSSKATLIAAALIVTGATGIFGTYAAEDQPSSEDQNHRPPIHQELTDEQKAALEEAKELFEAGDKEGAMAILKEAGIKPPKRHKNKGQFMKNLTDEQKEAFKEAQKLMKEGDMEGAKAILEEAGIKLPKKPGQRRCPGPEGNETE
jgi:exonuclease III